METDDRVVQKIFVIWDVLCILGKSFGRPFEVKRLPFHWSCFSHEEKHLYFISNNEKWLILNKVFWKLCHHSKCFSQYYKSFDFSTSINYQEALLYSFFTEELKILSNNSIQYVYLFILIYLQQYDKRLVR